MLPQRISNQDIVVFIPTVLHHSIIIQCKMKLCSLLTFHFEERRYCLSFLFFPDFPLNRNGEQGFLWNSLLLLNAHQYLTIWWVPKRSSRNWQNPMCSKGSTYSKTNLSEKSILTLIICKFLCHVHDYHRQKNVNLATCIM